MPETSATCKRCGQEVQADARRCSNCGYDVNSHSKWRWIWGLPGAVLTVSIIGSPIGLPMLWKAYKHRKSYQGTVAE